MKTRFIAGLAAGLACCALPAFAANSGWQSYQKISDNFFQGTGTAANILLVLSSNFNSCGSDANGTISLATLGSDQYQALAQVALVAVSEGRTVSLQINGCANGSAVVTGIRLGD